MTRTPTHIYPEAQLRPRVASAALRSRSLASRRSPGILVNSPVGDFIFICLRNKHGLPGDVLICIFIVSQSPCADSLASPDSCPISQLHWRCPLVSGFRCTLDPWRLQGSGLLTGASRITQSMDTQYTACVEVTVCFQSWKLEKRKCRGNRRVHLSFFQIIANLKKNFQYIY